MESRNRAARDSNESERENLSGEDGTSTVGEPGERRHLKRWKDDEDADGKRRDNADLHERRQIIAGREKKPHRQNRSSESVTHDQKCEGRTTERKDGSKSWVQRNPLSREQRENEKHDTDRACLQHTMRTNPSHVRTHQHRNRNREP